MACIDGGRAEAGPAVCRRLLSSSVSESPSPAHRAFQIAAGVLVALVLVVPLTLLAVPAQSQAQTVSGTVVSSDAGTPISGVSVAVKNSNVGTTTDASGRYSLEVSSLTSDTLTFSSIGYSRQEVPVNGQANVNVTLVPQAVSLEALVVVGYGTQQRRDVTGAVASVDTEDMAEVASPNVGQALQGRIAGVQVTPSSGEPGQDAVIRIRGVGTLGDAS